MNSFQKHIWNFQEIQNTYFVIFQLLIQQQHLEEKLKFQWQTGSKERYRIPEGTQTGTRFSIKNKGFKAISGNWRGDFVFTVIVQVPKRLTAEQRKLLVELAKTMNEQPPIKKKGIFG